MDIKKLIKKTKRNWKIKLLALFFASLFWLYVVYISRGALM